MNHIENKLKIVVSLNSLENVSSETFSSELIELSKLYRGITYVHMVDEGHKVKLCRSHGQDVRTLPLTATSQ